MGLVSSAISQLYSRINNNFFSKFFFFLYELLFKTTMEGMTSLETI